MGIERFFSSIKKEWKSFKDLYPPYKNNIKGDKLFIDFNSILYSIFPNSPPPSLHLSGGGGGGSGWEVKASPLF